jgi:hypothetical protein
VRGKRCRNQNSFGWGDHVSRNSEASRVSGHIIGVIREEIEFKGRCIRAFQARGVVSQHVGNMQETPCKHRAFLHHLTRTELPFGF